LTVLCTNTIFENADFDFNGKYLKIFKVKVNKFLIIFTIMKYFKPKLCITCLEPDFEKKAARVTSKKFSIIGVTFTRPRSYQPVIPPNLYSAVVVVVCQH